MSQKDTIQRVHKIDNVRLSDPITIKEIKPIAGESKTISEIALGKPSFWDRALGRTIKAKNKTGKIIYGVLTAGLSLLTGVNISPITFTEPIMTDFFTSFDINVWTVILFFWGAVVTYLKVKTGPIVDRILDKSEEGLELYASFKARDSEKGENISDGERDQLIDFFAHLFHKQKKVSP